MNKQTKTAMRKANQQLNAKQRIIGELWDSMPERTRGLMLVDEFDLRRGDVNMMLKLTWDELLGRVADVNRLMLAVRRWS